MTDESLALAQPYEIVSIRRAEAPSGKEARVLNVYRVASNCFIVNGALAPLNRTQGQGWPKP